MVDYSGPIKKDLNDVSLNLIQSGAICRGHLTYLSPELMATMHVDPPIFTLDEDRHSKHSDVYAYG